MILRKIPVKDIDLDEFERQLREFEPLPKASTLGASENPQAENAATIGAKGPKSGRGRPRDPSATASSLHSRQRSTKRSAKNTNLDDVERQLREVAFSVLRKSLPPSETGDSSVARDEQASGAVGGRVNADVKAAGAASQLGRMQVARWRRAAIHLKTYSEQNVVSRCARSLALPLLLLSFGIGAFVVLGPQAALTSIDHSLENARATLVASDDQKPSEAAVVTAASIDQPRQSMVLAEPSDPVTTQPVVSRGGDALTRPGPASLSNLPSSDSVLPSETSAKPHDAPEELPVGVADDNRGQSPPALDSTRFTSSPTKQVLEEGAAPATFALAQAEAVQTSESPPAVTPSPTPNAPASSSPAIESTDSGPGYSDRASSRDPVSEAPASLVAALARPEAPILPPTAMPSPAPEDAPSPSLAASKADQTGKIAYETPAQAMAIKASQSMPAIMPSPMSDDDAASNMAGAVANVPAFDVESSRTPVAAPDSINSRPDSNNGAFSQAPAVTLQGSTSLPPVIASPTLEAASSSKPENIASDESVRARPSSSTDTAFEAATLLPPLESPAMMPPATALPVEALAQATPDTPIEPAKPPAAELSVAQGSSGAAGATVPLRLSLASAPAGSLIIIHGLAAGSTLTAGRALEAGSWQLTADELHDAVLRPPQGFAGTMELELELRLPNDSVADRKTLHLQWAATGSSQTTRPPFVVRHLDFDEVAALLKRGEAFIASGDLASARLVLQRAAEAGEAQAALSLAGTFDPNVLDRLGLQGQKPDVEKARMWYQRAQELGSTAAPKRLQLLAGYNQ